MRFLFVNNKYLTFIMISKLNYFHTLVLWDYNGHIWGQFQHGQTYVINRKIVYAIQESNLEPLLLCGLSGQNASTAEGCQQWHNFLFFIYFIADTLTTRSRIHV